MKVSVKLKLVRTSFLVGKEEVESCFNHVSDCIPLGHKVHFLLVITFSMLCYNYHYTCSTNHCRNQQPKAYGFCWLSLEVANHSSGWRMTVWSGASFINVIFHVSLHKYNRIVSKEVKRISTSRIYHQTILFIYLWSTYYILRCFIRFDEEVLDHFSFRLE